jgi:endonuclease/exonuclease/phosphatase family metal-dependent hydrolase
LRAHLDRVFAAQPGCNLLCYGDFNDTKNTPVFHEVLGPRNTVGSLTDLAAKDDEGERWTHFWKESDQYSRIDYLFASPSLVPEIQKDSARIFRSADWSVASDHRPVFVTIVPVDK